LQLKRCKNVVQIIRGRIKDRNDERNERRTGGQARIERRRGALGKLDDRRIVLGDPSAALSLPLLLLALNRDFVDLRSRARQLLGVLNQPIKINRSS
jgi:hypothetical protein